MFSGLGAEVVGHDPVAPVGDVVRVDLAELVATCDVITLHAPPTPGAGRCSMPPCSVRSVRARCW